MCGIAGIFGDDWRVEQLIAMQYAQSHRGPDYRGLYLNSGNLVGLAHNRLSIIDLSKAGNQPMISGDGRYTIVFNGEIYNYLELRRELESEFEFRTRTDTEVLLAAYQKWGALFLDRLIGMFAFIIWDNRKKEAFVARDRFGVKPLYYHQKPDGTLFLSSEIKAIHAAGIKREANPKAWAEYLAYGLSDHSEETFWKGIYALPAGHTLTWRKNYTRMTRWYNLAEKVGEEFDRRDEREAQAEYLELLRDSVRLRFRSDVAVGVNLSGGVDSSSLLGLIHLLEKDESSVKAFTFVTGDERYDELPWVRQMLKQTAHPLIVSPLEPSEVPKLAASVNKYQDEPFGGIPTLAYAKLFENARRQGTIVLLDGNGLDEQWAGYDYYQSLNAHEPSILQGTNQKPVRAECLTPEFRALAASPDFPVVFSDHLRNVQYRDTRFTKIPRAMRFNDRISMRASTELREPFLDHRLFELAFRQPPERKIASGVGKKMLREIVRNFLPTNLATAPKRPVQTPQREWLRGGLREWADACISDALDRFGGVWLDEKSVKREWKNFCAGESDNSFYIWQWINSSLAAKTSETTWGENNFESRRSYQSSRAGQEISYR